MASDLEERVKQMAARAKTVAVETTLQLPLWREDVRGLPNSLARSALFNVANKKKQREFFKKKLIASVKGVEIVYQGEELRQMDEDVFLQMLHISRMQPLGEWVEFKAHAFLKALGWSPNSRSYDRLRECLIRLSTTTLTVRFDNGNQGYGGSLVRKFVWTEEDGTTKLQFWRVWLEKEIISLFGPVDYTRLDWEQRLSLPPLAKWLHAFYFTHREPLPYKVETLKTLCGSDAKTVYHFRSDLKAALQILKDVAFLSDWQHDSRTDTVRVVRNFKNRVH